LQHLTFSIPYSEDHTQRNIVSGCGDEQEDQQIKCNSFVSFNCSDNFYKDVKSVLQSTEITFKENKEGASYFMCICSYTLNARMLLLGIIYVTVTTGNTVKPLFNELLADWNIFH
jgi:hypothetical protein